MPVAKILVSDIVLKISRVPSNYLAGQIGDCSDSRLAGNGSSHMELKVTLSNATGPAGVTIAASPNGEEKTVIWYSPENYTINVDRSQSSNIDQFANYTVIGYYYPYSYANGTQEPLQMDIFVDGSLVEVYVNVSQDHGPDPIARVNSRM
jgi:sucrose-6-phosphate hydrolase SacC (GH32 family)